MTAHAPPLWQNAAAFAARAHLHQVRKDGRTPYVSHAFRVAMTVRDSFGCDDPTAICAALLHDTIEDTGVDYDEIQDAFGAEVAGLVAALTKNMILPESLREADYDARLSAADWRARLVKLADVYDNLSDRLNRADDAGGSLKDRCRRAVALADPDRGAHPETERAIALVRALMASA